MQHKSTPCIAMNITTHFPNNKLSILIHQSIVLHIVGSLALKTNCYNKQITIQKQLPHLLYNANCLNIWCPDIECKKAKINQ